MHLAAPFRVAENVDRRVGDALLLHRLEGDRPEQMLARLGPPKPNSGECVPMARNNGLSDAEIDAIGSKDSLDRIPEPYAVVCKATDEMCSRGTLHDERLGALLQAYGDTTPRKIILMIAWFNLLGLFLNGCRAPLGTTDRTGAKTSPLS